MAGMVAVLMDLSRSWFGQTAHFSSPATKNVSAWNRTFQWFGSGEAVTSSFHMATASDTSCSHRARKDVK